MSKHKSKKEWINLFKKYESNGNIPKVFFDTLTLKKYSNSMKNKNRKLSYKVVNARRRFINNYNLWKKDDNLFMNKKSETRGRPSKPNIDEIISDLTEKEKNDIIKRYIEITHNKKPKDRKSEANEFYWKIARKAKIFNIHRTSFYKNKKQRIYKFEHLKNKVKKIMIDSFNSYGSLRICEELKNVGYSINDRTLRNYLKRWGFRCVTRVNKRTREIKNTNVKYKDLVKRNFNPQSDNIVATDVSYLPAKEKQNFVYLSVVISHKTKLIESWKISKENNIKLVMDTLSDLPKNKNRIIHSDHGSQYSSIDVISWNEKNGYQTSMGRVGNSLDNREVEYFFSCLKSEFLNHIPTYNFEVNKISKIVGKYIDWYNTKRIQKRLQWKTPASASAYVI